MADEKLKFACGATSTVSPRLELIWTEALHRLARRCEDGVESHGDGAVNALSMPGNRKVYADMQFILARISHTVQHCLKLRDILIGVAQDDGDDHASAITWGGAFLCEATAELRRQISSTANCAGASTAPGANRAVDAGGSLPDLSGLESLLEEIDAVIHGMGRHGRPASKKKARKKKPASKAARR